MSEIGDIIDAEISRHSAFGGLTRVDDRRWVGASEHHLMRIFEFQPLKGDTISARWGWSLDFVPVLAGMRLRWKRTLKQAQPDLIIDPIDESGSVPTWCSFIRSSPAKLIVQTAAAAARAAAKDWDGVGSPGDLVGLYEKRSRLHFRRFSLSNYVQTDIAWGLARIATGDPGGRALLQSFANRFELTLEDPVFSKAIAEAEAIGSKP